MDHLCKKNNENPNGSEFKRRRDFHKKFAENDENEIFVLHNEAPMDFQNSKKEIKKVIFPNTSVSFKKKILSERKEESTAVSSLSPESKLVPDSEENGASNRISHTLSHSYDPITNYTSPRPKFLRYDPNKRRELLQCVEGDNKLGDEEVRSASSSSDSSEGGDESDYEEVEKKKKKRKLFPCVVTSLFLTFGVLLFILYCVSSVSHPFERYERSADSYQKKIQGNTSLRLLRKGSIPENVLGGLMSLSHMCPLIAESTCYLVEYDSALINEDGREMSHKTEVFIAESQDLVLKNGGLVSNNSVIKEQSEHDERDSGSSAKEDDANYSISTVDTLKENSNAFSIVEPLQLPLAQHNVNNLTIYRNDTFYIEDLVSNETSLTTEQGKDRIFTADDDQGPEEFEFSSNSDDPELKSVSNSNIISILLVLLVTVIGFSISLQKYLQKQHLNSVLPSSPPPPSEFGLKQEEKEDIVSIPPMIESTSSRLNVAPFPLNHSNFEVKKMKEFGPPRVEFLGEFSVHDPPVRNNDLNSNPKEMEFLDSQSSHYRKRRATKKFCSSSDMLESSPSVESTSRRLSSKVTAYKGEASDSSITPLRRSSRLQKR